MAGIRRPRAIAKNLWLLLIDTVARWAPVRKRQPGTRPRILIVRLDAIGDFVLWLSAASQLRKTFPQTDYELVLLANATWSTLAEEVGLFDRVRPADKIRLREDPGYRFSVMRWVRKEGFDTVIEPTYSREFLLGDSVARVSGAKKRVGHAGDLTNIGRFQRGLSDRWFTEVVNIDGDNLMELERNHAFAAAIGAAAGKPKPPSLPRELREVSVIEGDYLVLFVGASIPGKKWPAGKYAELARRLQASTGWLIVVCGTTEDGQAEEICAVAGIRGLNMIGRTTLVELCSVLGNARVVIGNDTGPLHIASALGVPVVVIVGGGHPGRFFPYAVEPDGEHPLPVAVTCPMPCFSCNWICKFKVAPRAPFPCVESVGVDEVEREVKAALQRKEDPARPDAVCAGRGGILSAGFGSLSD